MTNTDLNNYCIILFQSNTGQKNYKRNNITITNKINYMNENIENI